MVEPASRSRAARAGTGDAMTRPGGRGKTHGPAVPETSLSEALSDLVATLDRASEELFAAVPFLGDQATGASVNAYVDEAVAAMRGMRADADDLRRVLAISERAPRGST